VFFNLLQRKFVIGAFIPVGFAIEGVKIKADLFGVRTPVGALGNADSFHAPFALREIVLRESILREMPYRRMRYQRASDEMLAGKQSEINRRKFYVPPLAARIHRDEPIAPLAGELAKGEWLLHRLRVQREYW